jgi:DNA-binding NtrC family response regulator
MLARMAGETIDASDAFVQIASGPAPTPGLILIFSGGKAAAIPLALVDGEVVLGRDLPIFTVHPDASMSRRHALVRFDGRRFVVTDLGSRNGTSVDGGPLRPEVPRELERVLRIGSSLLVPVRDLAPIQRFGVRLTAGRVEGPALQAALEATAQAARLGTTLHITGESGAGKEGLARAFHESGPGANGPFQAVNCASIPETVAERLLFGARRGAFSGADADADGYLQAAHGGTLFLDEVAELDLAVQAKLLRVLETGEVLQLGASKPRKIDLRFCSATHRDLRAQVAAGSLREDLYFRIASPRVVAPPLRERSAEIPWLLQAEAARIAPELTIHASLVETCLLRPWPGNVRELCAEARSAAQAALSAGSARVEARHLGELAGSAFAPGTPESRSDTPPRAEPLEPTASPSAAPSPSSPPPTRARLTGVLTRAQGNVSAAARELGVHRTQLRRWMERHGLDPRAFEPSPK